MSGFYCERLRCSGVTPVSCVKRQKAKAAGNGKSGRDKYEDCQDCPQGKAIIREHPEAVEEAGLRRPIQRGSLPAAKPGTQPSYHKKPSMKEPAKSSKQEDVMPKTKECRTCGKEFMPRSNRQMFCEEHSKKVTRKARAKQPRAESATAEPRNNGTKPKAGQSEAVSRRAKSRPSPTQPTGRGEAEVIHLLLDDYPDIREKLIQEADAQFRRPVDHIRAVLAVHYGLIERAETAA